MSYTEPMLIEKPRRGFGRPTITGIEELHNSHGWGPFVWDSVALKYLGDEYGWFVRGQGEELWPLWKDPRLPLHWSAALLATYDYAIIERDRMREVAGHLRAFVRDVGTRQRVCHLPRIADLLEKHAAGRRVIGMCFYGTSICEDWWHPWDSDKDRGTTLDIRKPGQHWFVGASLDKLPVPAPRDAGKE